MGEATVINIKAKWTAEIFTLKIAIEMSNSKGQIHVCKCTQSTHNAHNIQLLYQGSFFGSHM